MSPFALLGVLGVVDVDSAVLDSGVVAVNLANPGFPLRHSVLNSTLMRIGPELTPAAVDHVSSMLALAKLKHEEAMAMVGAPDANAILRLRQVLQLLEEVELLAEDAGSYVDSDAMGAALKELRQQQASIRHSIDRLENLSKRSPSVSPWPWIVLVMVVVAVSAVAA